MCFVYLFVCLLCCSVVVHTTKSHKMCLCTHTHPCTHTPNQILRHTSVSPLVVWGWGVCVCVCVFFSATFKRYNDFETMFSHPFPIIIVKFVHYPPRGIEQLFKNINRGIDAPTLYQSRVCLFCNVFVCFVFMLTIHSRFCFTTDPVTIRCL